MADFHGWSVGNPEAYVARKPCGCVVGLAVNLLDDESREELAEYMTTWIKWGAEIEGHTLESSRKPENAPLGCNHV
jgi:hypothetical protein